MEGKSYYIASALENADMVKEVHRALQARGHRPTYDWTRHGSVQSEGRDRIREVAESELRGVTSADFVVVILPGGRGTHTELGAALALGVPVFIYAGGAADLVKAGRICAFYCHPQVHLHEQEADLRGIVDAVQAWLKRSPPAWLGSFVRDTIPPHLPDVCLYYLDGNHTLHTMWTELCVGPGGGHALRWALPDVDDDELGAPGPVVGFVAFGDVGPTLAPWQQREQTGGR